MNVGRPRRSEGEMIKVHGAGRDLDGWSVAVADIEIKGRISDARLRRSNRPIDRNVPPISARPIASEVNRRVARAFGHENAAVGDGQIYTAIELQRHT